MASFNKVLLMGNLTRDPQMRYLPSQTPVCEFGLACNRKYRTANGEDREDVLFIDCTAFGRQAEVINQYCQKGKGIFVEGRLKLDSWEDKQSGQKRSKHGVVVDNFQFLGGRDDGPRGGGASGSSGRDEYADFGGGGDDSGGGSGAAPRGRTPPRRDAGASRENRPESRPSDPFDDAQQFADDDIPF